MKAGRPFPGHTFSQRLFHHLREFIRYTWASMLALGADGMTLIMLVEWGGMQYLLAAAMGFCTGLTTLYLMSTRWVFNQRRYANTKVEFLIFALIGLGGLLLTLIIMALGTEVVGLDYRISKLLAAGSSFLFNYVLRKRIVFTELTHAHP